MKQHPIAIRPFIGARDFEQSRRFYQDMGFHETVIGPALSLFEWKKLGFYLQNAYVKEWADNTMVFFQVENTDHIYDELASLQLSLKYPGVKLSPVRTEEWGRECFLHDPSGILWHFGEFTSITHIIPH